MEYRDEQPIWKKYPKICHYTTVESALKILETKCLHASSAEYVEDKKEFQFWKDLLSEKWLSVAEGKGIHVTKEEVYSEIERIYDKSLKGCGYLLSFAVSTTEVLIDEDDGILSMWRYYGKNNGCYIEYNTEKIFHKIDKIDPQHMFYLFDEVIYCKKDNCNERARVDKLMNS